MGNSKVVTGNVIGTWALLWAHYALRIYCSYKVLRVRTLDGIVTNIADSQKFKSYFTSVAFYLFHVDNATNTVTLLHLVEGAVDSTQRLAVSNELVHLELAVQVVVHQTGQLGAALDATEGTSLPDTTGNQLECCEELAEPSKNKRKENLRRVEISWPAAATPMTMLSPQPLWQASRAARMTPTLPVQSKV